MGSGYSIYEFIKKCILPFLAQSNNVLIEVLIEVIKDENELQNHVFYKRHPSLCLYLSAIKQILTPYISTADKGIITIDENCFQRINGEISDLLAKYMLYLSDDIDQDFIGALACERYEKGENNGYSLAIIPTQMVFAQDKLFLPFESQNRLSLHMEYVHAIRKQLNISQKGALAVAWNNTLKCYETVGVLQGELSIRFPWFEFRNSGEWWFCLPTDSDAPKMEDRKRESCRFLVKQGAFLLPPINLADEVQDFFKKKQILKNQTSCNAIADIVTIAAKCSHGALLIFGPTSIVKKEYSRLVKKWNRGMLLNAPINFSDIKRREDQFLQLASIDGAMLFDFDGKCYAYGVILDGITSVQGNMGRGSRYNSAITYIRRKSWHILHRGVFAVVCSEDGMIDIIF